MATRGLVLAVLAAFAPSMALAQGVPQPAKPLVGPPVDYRGEGPAPPTASAVPPARFLSAGPPAPGTGAPSAAEQSETGAGIVDATSKFGAAGETGLEAMSRNVADNLTPEWLRGSPDADAAKRLGVSGAVGVGANIVGVGANVGVMAEKCSGPGFNGSECGEAGLNAASNFLSATGTAANSAGFGKAGNAAQLAADLVGLQRNCTDPNAPVGSCVISAFDSAMSAGATFVPGGELPAAGYTIGKSVLPAAFDSASQKIYGQSLGYEYYDVFFAEGDEARIDAASTSPALLEQQRARRRAAYQAAASSLTAKQEAYDAEQARIEAERQAQIAAQQQAAMQAQANQQFVNTMIGLQQSYLPQAIAPASADGGYPFIKDLNPCWDMRRTCVNGQPGPWRTSSDPPPSASDSAPPPGSGGCGLTAADRAKGLVCTQQ